MRSQSKISFILDDKIINIDFSEGNKYKPTTTLLEYLRSLGTKKGVKEGCGQGDCGACTIVLGEFDRKKGITYKSVNSCLILLPMIHGKQIITIENLATKTKNKIRLHPVQQAIIDSNSSQCGYCTPGMTMSLFALFKNHNKASRELIEDYLVGNICRCTGYQPLIKIAQESFSTHNDHFEENKTEIIKLLKEIKNSSGFISISSNNVHYFKSNKLSESLQILKENPDAVLLNGGTDFSIKNFNDKDKTFKIIDISDIEELQYFSEDEHNYYIGAGVELEKLKNISSGKLKSLENILKIFGSLQIRNLATIGGNLGGASPIGDIIPFLIALNAKVKLQSISKSRIIKVEEFILSYRKTNIKADEIIESLIIPKPGKNKISCYKISKRKNLDISTVSVCFNLLLSSNYIVEEIRIVFGGMAEITKRAAKTENFLLKKKWERKTINKAIEILKVEFTPISDARSGKEFRRITAGNLLLKFWSKTNE